MPETVPHWEAMRVFVPEEQVDSVVTPDYLAIKIADLERLLAEEARRRAQTAGQDSGIKRAVYLARWDNQKFGSNVSMWQVAFPTNQPRVNLSRTSLAIEEPRLESLRSQSLSKQLRYLDDARLQLLGDGLPDGSTQTLWFGFNAKCVRGESDQPIVEFNVPQAALGTMLIAVPAGAVVTSNLPCSRVTNPLKYLPEDWPSMALPSINSEEHWYVVIMSGRDQCSLRMTPAEVTSRLPYRMNVASAHCDTLVDSSGIEVNARFQLSKMPPRRSLRLRVEAPLHVRSINVNGTEVSSWRTIDERDQFGPGSRSDSNLDRHQWHCIEMGFDADWNGPLQIGLEAIAALRTPFNNELPRVEVADGYVLDGRSTLSLTDELLLEDVSCENLKLTATNNGPRSSWQSQWTGQAPRISARIRPSTSQWQVRSLTKLSVQSGLIVANTHVNLSGSAIKSNQVSLKLAKGWFVDSIELENAPSGVSAMLRDMGSDIAEYIVRMDERLDDLDLRVAINAHFPLRTELERLRIPLPRIVNLPGADQIDSYALESSGRFQLDPEPELMRLRVQAEELPLWQRDLLAGPVDGWVFRSHQGSLPAMMLKRTRPTMTSRLHTTVTQLEKEVLLTYRIACQPISGSIDQVRLLLPIPSQAVAPTWSLVAHSDSIYPRGLSISSRATSSSSGETAFTIDLSQAITTGFQMESELRLPIESSSFAVPLPSVPQAVSQDAIAVIAHGLVLSGNERGIEILPERAGHTNSNLESIVSLHEERSDLVVRYDPNLLIQLHLTRPQSISRGTWATSELHQHWHFGNATLHRSQWEIAAANSRTIEYSLPKDWEINSVYVNGVVAEIVRPAPNTLRIGIPEGITNLVTLECSSFEIGSRSIQSQEPICGIPALRKRRIVWLSSTEMAFPYWPEFSHMRWEERFLPSFWWSWLHIDPYSRYSPVTQTVREGHWSATSNPSISSPTISKIESNNAPALKALDGRRSPGPHSAIGTDAATGIWDNWWSLELDKSDEDVHLIRVSRSLVSSVLLSMALLLAAFLYFFCGRRISWWWTIWTASIVCLCVVPNVYLPLLQLWIVSLVTATLVLASSQIISRSRPAPKVREQSGRVSTVRRSQAVSLAVLVSCIGLNGTAHSQSTNRNQQRAEVFGILIPVDSDLEVAGEIAYVPTRLSRLLSSSPKLDSIGLPISIQSAHYSLRVSNDPATLSTSLGELTTELNVHSPRIDSELRLPFTGIELSLQRAFLDSQEIFLGERLKQDNDGVVWRAPDANRHTLRLVFRPRTVTEREGRGSLSVGIPAVPMARLEIMGDDLRGVSVDSIGPSQLESPRFLTAILGPVNRLSIGWPLTLNRSGTIQVQSDTWIHTHGEQLIAQCQLRIRGAGALPGLLHIVGDNNWQPVGEDWEDGQLLEPKGESATGRPVYTVERSSNDTITIRVMLLPKTEALTTSLSIPFLSLQEANTQQRTLAISHAQSPQWKTTGTESWQLLLASQAGSIWEEGRPSDLPTLLKVPPGTMNAALQRTSTVQTTTVEETTEISLRLPEVRLKYLARWSQAVVGDATIRVRIPNSWRVDAAFVDSLPTRHTTQRLSGDNASESEVIIFVGARGGIQMLNLQLSAPARLNKAWLIPRPTLQNYKVVSSVLQLFRGAELTSQMQIGDQVEFNLEEPLLQPNATLLQNLHTAMGRVELGDRLRSAAELPVEIKLARAPTNKQAQAIMRLQRTEQGWRARIDAVADAPNGEESHFLFEVPNSLASSFLDPIEASPMLLWPSADVNRSILSVMPQLGNDGKAHASFTIRLPSTGASQSVSIPNIRLTSLGTAPVLALPDSLAGDEIGWNQVGRLLPENWLRTHGFEHIDLSGYSLYEPNANQFQAIWHSRQTEMKSPAVLLTQLLISSDNSETVCGDATYWIDPQNQTSLTIQLPRSCSLIGAQSSGKAIHWTELDANQIRIRTQPSYLPFQLRLFFQWDYRQQLELPKVIAQNSGDMLVGVQGKSLLLPNPLSRLEHEQCVANAWANAIFQSAPIAADRQLSELHSWITDWSPVRLKLNGSLMVPSLAKLFVTETEPAIPATETVSAFWKQFVDTLRMRHTGDSDGQGFVDELAAPENQYSLVNGASVQWHRLETTTASANIGVEGAMVLNLEPRLEEHMEMTYHRVLSAGMVLVISMVLWWLCWVLMSKRVAWLSEAVWPLWVGLAIFSWLFLPVLWPCLVILLCSLVVIWRRKRELRQDRRFVLVARNR